MAVQATDPVPAAPARRWRVDRWFYIGGVLLVILSNATGFGPSLVITSGRLGPITALVTAQAIAQSGSQSPPGGAVVTTTSGAVSGITVGNRVVAYLGIPYGAPPIRQLRWKPPEPAPRWTGVRAATKLGAPCAQAAIVGGPPPPDGIERMSEDCLTLNVWVPPRQLEDVLPVMVHIHAGGFYVGAGSTAPAVEAALASQGVVVVSMNYRLGVFGFLAHPELSKESPSGTSGNYALLDQIAALRWVKANARAFGGDPDRVTIFGTSAGGSAVLYLMASPLTKGLFQRAIAQSAASVYTPLRYRQRRAFGYEPAEAVGLKLGTDIAALRMLPAGEILANMNAPPNVPADAALWPAVDGYVLPAHPADLFEQGRITDVPLIIGNTTDEGTAFWLIGPIKTVAGWRDFARKMYPAASEDLLAQYPANTDADVFRAYSRYVTDWIFLGTTRGVARALAKHNGRVWRYEFTRVNPGTWPVPNPPLGAWHSSEWPYVFGRLAGQGPRPNPYVAVDHALAKAMSAAWVRFAATGDPNGGDLPAWPRYSTTDERRMAFGDTITVGPDPNAKALDAYDRAFEKIRQTAR